MPKKLLIVEDDHMIAMDMEDFFESLGFEIVGPASDLNQALTLIEKEEIECATLDYNLGDETSLEAAKKLSDRSVPFVFITGYTSKIKQTPDAPEAPVYTKPVVYDEVAEYLLAA